MRNAHSNGKKSQNYLNFEKNWSENVTTLHKSLVASEMQNFLKLLFQMHETHPVVIHAPNFCSVTKACCHHEFERMDCSHFSNYNFKEFYCNSITTPLQKSFIYPLACVTYTIKEQGVGQKKDLIINEFIPMFFLLYGTYMECPWLNKLRDLG